MMDQPTQDRGPRGGRSRIASLALVVSVAAGAVGGGVVGSAATLYVVQGQQGQQGQPVAQTPLAPASVAVPTPAPPQTTAVELRENGVFTGVFQQAGPSVVSVSTGGEGAFGQDRQRGEGSGFVVDADGLILTNHHVVEGASRISVQFHDGSLASARVLGSDPLSDLALLKVDRLAEGVGVATLADSDQVQPGQTAIAIGSPFGLTQTITAGIVSAVNREWRGRAAGRQMRGLIQTDAPVNPGNSGGPLLNSRGEVIGITTAIESPVRGSVGIGFAVPINEAKRLMPSLAQGEQVQHPWLGIAGSGVTPELVDELGLSVQQGVLIHEVAPDSPAARAGLQGGTAASEADLPVGGDVITAVDGSPVRSVQELAEYLNTRGVGEQVRLSVVRNGNQIDLTATLGAWPVGNQG